MDYSCDKVSDCSFSRFGSVVRTDNTQTHTHARRRTDADERFTLATVVGVSKKRVKTEHFI